MSEKRKISIFGYGRFGELWAEILRNDFEVFIQDSDPQKQNRAKEKGYSTGTIRELLANDVVFYAVPMSSFEEVLVSHLKKLDLDKLPLFADLLSVKVHPLNVFEKHLPADARALLLHPLFGPDAVDSTGTIVGLPIVVDSLRLEEEELTYWMKLFASKGLNVCRMTAQEHDKLAAWSQGLTHYIGRIIGLMDVKATSIDTVGAKKLHEIKDQVWNDSWELFINLQTLNPYTKEMRLALDSAERKLFNALLPNRIHTDRLVVGVQGGRGSFNETAALHYLEKHQIARFEIVYLYTSEQVLKSLHEGEIDRGQFAIHNSVGGIVTESVQAISRYNFNILEEFQIPITHALMIHNNREFSEITSAMAHPQVFQQCRSNLKKQFPNLPLKSGEGELIDSARAAELLMQGHISSDTAIMGNPAIASLYGLKIVADNLQDLENNLTSFLWIERSYLATY